MATQTSAESSEKSRRTILADGDQFRKHLNILDTHRFMDTDRMHMQGQRELSDSSENFLYRALGNPLALLWACVLSVLNYCLVIQEVSILENECLSKIIL